MNIATIKIPPFGHSFQDDKLQIILPDGRDVAPDLFIQRIEVVMAVDDFATVKITCCAKVEVRPIYPGDIGSFGSWVAPSLQLAYAVKHSGWR